MAVFIRAARHGTISAESPSPVAAKKRMVHDAILLGCKPLLLRFAAAMYLEELRERDELSGRVPLHMAAAQGSKHILQTVLELVKPQTISVRDSGGQLPLHVAIQARREWEGALEILVSAWPYSLTIHDSRTGLLPAVLAPMSECSLDASFHLLSADPMEVVRIPLDQSTA